MVIVFSGLDCSGKSTQIDILKQKLKKKGQKNMVFWSRGGYTPGFQKIKDVIRMYGGKSMPEPGHTLQREEALSNPIIRKVWLTVAMMDLIYYYAIYLRIKSQLGYTIICDRYMMDTNIDFHLTYPMEGTEKWVLWKILKFTAVKPDFHFVSTIPVPESVRRSKFKYEPFPDTPEVLLLRLDLYQKELAENYNIIYINGMRSISSIEKEIENAISL
jgi:thymidylate kinase